MKNALDHTKPGSTMLNYCKIILDKISFDRKLLRKEYRKSLRWLNQEECTLLKAWMRERFRGELSVRLSAEYTVAQKKYGRSYPTN